MVYPGIQPQTQNGAKNPRMQPKALLALGILWGWDTGHAGGVSWAREELVSDLPTPHRAEGAAHIPANLCFHNAPILTKNKSPFHEHQNECLEKTGSRKFRESEAGVVHSRLQAFRAEGWKALI